MKYLNYLISVSFFSWGIPQLPSSFTNLVRTISNESGHQARIVTYFNQYDPSLDTIVQIDLRDGESHTLEGIYAFTEVQYRLQESLIETYVFVDSVVVIFDSEKSDVHCLEITKNSYSEDSVIGLISYSNGSVDMQEIKHIISREDHENAKDCNGHPRCGG